MIESNKIPWIAAIGGGIVGAVLTAGALYLAGPSLIGDRMVRDALIANPEMLVEAGNALRDRQFAQSLAPIRAAVERPFHSSWKGAEKPDVTLTYFYDYACGYCRQSNPDIERLLKEDKGLRVVFRELPILGPESVAAARVSLSASKAGKFAAYHDALYAAGRPSQETITLAAKAAGIGQCRRANQVVQRRARAEQLDELRLQLVGRRFLHPGHQRLEPAKRQLARLFVGPGGRKTAIHCQGVAHAGNEHASSHVLEELSAAVAVHERTP